MCKFLIGSILILFSSVILADTKLDVEIDSCQRTVNNDVVCDFQIKSDISRAMALTGGQYSQAIVDSDHFYNSAKVEVQGHVGMAVGFEIEPGVFLIARLWFENIDATVEEFEKLTMRFSDGNWQLENVTVKSQ